MNAPANSRRVLMLGHSGDTAVQAIEFLEDMGLEPAIIDVPAVDKLDSLRDAAYALVMPSEDDDAAAMMLAVGFMLGTMGRQRICLVGDGSATPAALKGAMVVTPDDSGLWKLLLAREMKRSGLDVDLNKAL